MAGISSAGAGAVVTGLDGVYHHIGRFVEVTPAAVRVSSGGCCLGRLADTDSPMSGLEGSVSVEWSRVFQSIACSKR
jgi:hypothetical protein